MKPAMLLVFVMLLPSVAAAQGQGPTLEEHIESVLAETEELVEAIGEEDRRARIMVRFKYSALGGSIVELHEIEAQNQNAQDKASRAAERVYQAGAAVDAANDRTQDVGGAILSGLSASLPVTGPLLGLLGLGGVNKARTGRWLPGAADVGGGARRAPVTRRSTSHAAPASPVVYDIDDDPMKVIGRALDQIDAQEAEKKRVDKLLAVHRGSSNGAIPH